MNGLINPKLIPGAFANYNLTITAPASTSPTNNSVITTDALPTNLSLFVGTMPPVPARYAYSFTSLANAADDLDFTNNGGASWT